MTARRSGHGDVAPEIEVLIPSWNGRERLRRAVESLRAQTVVPSICVVDNGSTDGSGDMIRSDHPEVRLVELGANLGFGAALNRGVAGSEARLVAFINNDAVADPGLAEELLAENRRTGAEMVAGCMVSPGGRIESAGVVVDRSLVAYDLLHGRTYDPAAAWLETAGPLAPSGGAGAYLREAFEAVGGFDQAFFAYLEDVDLGIRMRLEGMACSVAPRAFVVHEHAATLGSGSAGKNRLMGRGRGRILWKHGTGLTRPERARGWVLDAVTYAGQAVIDRNLGAVGGRLEDARSRRSLQRPAADPRFERVPRVDLKLREALRRRLARRRLSSGE